jgi:hypothetical protein
MKFYYRAIIGSIIFVFLTMGNKTKVFAQDCSNYSCGVCKHAEWDEDTQTCKCVNDEDGTSCGTITINCSSTRCSSYRYQCSEATQASCTKTCQGGYCISCFPSCPYSDCGTDEDGDGYDKECGDCDDQNPQINPGETEKWDEDYCEIDGDTYIYNENCPCSDNKDNDCDGKIDFAEGTNCYQLNVGWVINTTEEVYADVDEATVTINGSLTILEGKTLTAEILIIGEGGKLSIKEGACLEAKNIYLNERGSIEVERSGRIKTQHIYSSAWGKIELVDGARIEME